MLKPKEGEYSIIGRPESGYSMKVLSAMHYKGVAHQWMDRFSHHKLYKQHAKVQLIPLVFLPDGTAVQDSTPVLELLEARHPQPSIYPDDIALRFLSDVLEEYGDEWVNKLMFHYRWGYPADQKHRAKTLAEGTVAGLTTPLIGKIGGPLLAPLLIKRMVPRMAFAGANDNNKPLLVESFENLVDMLQNHLLSRSYLFGERPSFGDFGLWGQMYQAYIDPSCGAILRQRGPAVVAWIERMLEPEKYGEYETLESLEPTLAPLFSREVGPRFLAWDVANARAWDAGEAQTELEMDGRHYYQKTFKYPAQALGILKGKFNQASSDGELVRFLESTGCLQYLTGTDPTGVSAGSLKE
ncbi:glutathione S-transferase family protein [Kineobactrum sediminis]|nr:glutathione S-transferase family protein [Kineobactrum sediminis]